MHFWPIGNFTLKIPRIRINTGSTADSCFGPKSIKTHESAQKDGFFWQHLAADLQQNAAGFANSGSF